MAWNTFKYAMIVLVCLLILPFLILVCAVPFNSRTPSETDLSKSALLKKTVPPLAKELTLKLVTFNLHDLYLAATDRPERMQAIGQVLTDLDPDVVGFQEAWISSDRQVLCDTTIRSRLQYHQYYPSGTVGSGLFIMSAYPISEAFFHRYTKNGKWYKPYHGDWWGGKGVALARIELPDGAGYFDFYDTHAHAGYGNSHEYDADRKSQMEELADFMQKASLKTVPAFLAGDMNSGLESEALQIAIKNAPLKRLMTISTGIDHIFALDNPKYKFNVLDTQPIQKVIHVNGHDTQLSDHNGYISTVQVVPSAS